MIGAAVLVLLMAMLVRSFWRPGVLVAFLLLYFAAKQLVQLSFPYFAEYSSLLNYVVFGGVLLVWTAHSLSEGRMMLRIPPEYGMHLLFFALAFLSTLWSMDTDIREHLGWIVARTVLFALVAPTLLASTRGLNEAFQWITWAGGAMSLAFLFLSIGSDDVSRLAFTAPTATGGDLVLSPLALGSMGAYTVTTSMLGVFPRGKFVSVLRLLAACLGLVVAGRSSRGDLFAGIIAVGLLGLIPNSTVTGLRPRRLLTILAASAVFAGVLYYSLFMTSYGERYLSMADDMSVREREFLLGGVLEYYYNHPSTWLFGSGWWSSFAIVGYYPHNGLVQALVELGLLGALLWLASVVFVFARGLRLVILAARTGVRSMDVVRPALGLMICALVSNLKAGDCVDGWLALTLATVAQLVRRFRKEHWESVPPEVIGTDRDHLAVEPSALEPGT